MARRSFSELENLVTSRGLCRLCGACALICPVDVIRVTPFKAELVGDCISCGLCLEVCPVLNRPPIFEPKRVYFAKPRVTPPKFKTCGVTTEILSSLLLKDAVDEVLVSVMDRGMTPVSRLANSVEGVKASGGANYFSFGHLHHLRDSLAKRKRIALVGVGCSVEGAYHIAARSKAYAESLKYKVGLFCSSQLDRDETVSLLLERGITPEKVETVNIRGGFVHVGLIGGGVVRTKLAEFEAAKRRGCAFCLNVENSCADLSIGEMGAPAGRVIVAVRTAAGEEAIRIAGDELELEEARGDVMSRARDVVLRKSKSLSDVRSSHPSD